MKKALLLAGLLPALAWAADKPAAQKPRPNLPGVDWNARTVRATGRGAPALNAPSVASARLGAERAAEMDALRNILATLKSVQITTEQTVGQAMSASDGVRGKVEGEARGFRRVDTRYFSDGGVEIDVEMTLEGLLDELMPARGEARPLPSVGEAAHTGLIIDARGLKAKPALAPRLLDPQGGELYGAAEVAPEALKKNGLAGYSQSLEEAKKSGRVGDKPLVVKAEKLSGASDLVLAGADAQTLRDPKGNVSFLGQGRVIIVVD